MDIDKILELLPKIIYYVVPGYCFLKIMTFVNYRVLEDNEYILLKSVVISYILIMLGKIIQGKLPFLIGISFEYKCLLLIITSIIAGYISGKVMESYKFDWVLEKMKIHRTKQSIIWHDIFKPDQVTYLRFYKTESEYIQGQLYLIEGNKEDPGIILKYPQTYKGGAFHPNNYKDSPNELLLKPSNYIWIEIIYKNNTRIEGI